MDQMEMAPAYSASSDQPIPSLSAIDSDDEGVDVCRICRNPGELDDPLRYPCACNGSIKYVHQDCLVQWLNRSNARRCEVCRHAFSFSPVYAENAPIRLSFQEFIVGTVNKARHVQKFFFHFSYVLFVWLFIIPLTTFWIWRLAFVRSFGEVQRLVLSHISSDIIPTDRMNGLLLSTSIVSIFLGHIILRDCFRLLQDFVGQNVDRDEDGDINGARAARRPPMQANMMEVNVDNVVRAQGIVGAGQIIRRVAENIAANVEQIVDGMDDAEDAPFDELIRMQMVLLPVLARNIIFVGVMMFVPFSLGWVILHYVSWILVSDTTPFLLAMIPLADSALSSANITLKSALINLENLSSDGQNNNLLEKLTKMMNASAPGLHGANNLTSSLASDSMKGLPVGTSQISDVTTLAVGYIFIFFLVFLYLGTVALIRYAKGEPLTTGMFYCIASIAETIPFNFRQYVAAMRLFMTMIKFTFLLVIEHGVFPLICGWWLDICTIQMFDTSIFQRVEFFSAIPPISLMIHWIVGIGYMRLISFFVSLFRGVLRTGVLYFLRDPVDPIYNPLFYFIYDPVHQHGRRFLSFVGVYGILIVMLVFIPVKFSMRIVPSLFPLDISVFYPVSEVLVGLVLFQICIPLTVDYFNLETTAKSVLRYWFTAVGWALDLTDFLLPKPEENSGQENGNAEPIRQNRRHIQIDGQDQVIERLSNPDNNTGRSVLPNDIPADVQSESEYGFAFRIVLLLVMVYITLVIFSSALIVVPVLLGRTLFKLITLGIKCNDMYAFVIGGYAIWTGTVGWRYFADHFRTKTVRVMLRNVLKWGGIVLKISALLSICVFIIPLLMGLLFELLITGPMSVSLNESLFLQVYQNWTMGLVFLKIGIRMVMLEKLVLLVDDSWRVKFQRVIDHGFLRLQGFWVLQEIVFPITIRLLTALCVPYLLARVIFPVFGYSLVINSAVYRFAWLGCLCLSVVCFCAMRLRVWFTKLHNSIKDDRYLIGCRLRNFGDVKSQNETKL